MSNVIVDKNKIDILANAISVKSGEAVTMTLDEMVSAVDGIETGGGTPTLETITKTYTPSTSAVIDTITPSSGYDGIEEVDVTVSAVPLANPYIYTDIGGYYTVNNQRAWKLRGAISIDNVEGDNEGYINEGNYYGNYYTYSAIATGTSVTPTESSQTIGGSNYMMEGAVTVNAIPSNYVGSGITSRSSLDLSASGATVTAPSGYYASSATKTIASGTAGTPTATKGAVNNHAISVTPSVTNTTGYITGSTKTGTAVSVSASELVSGSQTISDNGDYDVTNLASVTVSVSGGGGTSKNVQVLQSTSRTNSSSLTKVLGDLTVSKTGTYDIYWSGGRTNTSTSYTWGTRLYVDGTGYDTENTTWSNNCQSNHLSNVSLTANQKLSVYARGRTGSYYTFAPMLVIVEA